jgi:3-deoxy-D-manno-oct-2-ulosonic acid (Kdo) hydroxylase
VRSVRLQADLKYDEPPLTTITKLDGDWTAPATASTAKEAVESLERGDVLFFPALSFAIEAHEAGLFSPAILSSAKNASYDPSTNRVGGTTTEGAELERLRGLMARFSDRADAFVRNLLPSYRSNLQRARASFRPAEIAGRASSWRKDDTRLHVDSFPASPVQGRRILRLFANVNPSGKARSWRVGDDFERVAGRFAGRLARPMPGAAIVLRLLRVTKTRRSAYDALMLQLHDLMKGDADFQAHSPQTPFDFPAGSTWIAFTDQVSHAANAGQYQLEQTFLLPVTAMSDESRSPLRILERLKGRRLTSTPWPSLRA